MILTQCIRVQAASDYEVGGEMRIPAGQPDDTRAYILVNTHTNESCDSSAIQKWEIMATGVDVWTRLTQQITTDPGITALSVNLAVYKPSGEIADAEAFFDNVFMLLPGGEFTTGPSMSASWYNPAEGGHGIMIDLLDDSRAWLCWFTFTLTGEPAWICALGDIEGDTITFDDAFTVDGGAFPPNFDKSQIVEVPWGSIVVTFTGCDEGTMSWTTSAPGFQSGSMPLARLTSLWGGTCP